MTPAEKKLSRAFPWRVIVTPAENKNKKRRRTPAEKKTVAKLKNKAEVDNFIAAQVTLHEARLSVFRGNTPFAPKGTVLSAEEANRRGYDRPPDWPDQLNNYFDRDRINRELAGRDEAAKATLDALIQEEEKTKAENERDEAETRAANIRRESLVVSPGAMPQGPLGDAFRELTPDARQIVNLRLSTNAKGKRLSFREVAEQFRCKNKSAKKYTDERCRQIYAAAMEKHPELADFVDALAKRKAVKLAQTRPKTDREEIEEMTTTEEFDANDLNDEDGTRNRGYRVDKSPRKPLYLANTRR